MTQQDLTRIGEINALLGRGTEYEGKLCFEGRVRLDGRFRGAIHSDDMLIVGDGADVDAQIVVGKLIVRGGTVRGKIVASQLVELFAPAKIYADIETPLFFVDRGVVFEGRCTMGEVPTEVRPMDDGASGEAETAKAEARPRSKAANKASSPTESEDEIEPESAESEAEPSTDASPDDAQSAAEDSKPRRKRSRKSKP